MLKDREYVRIEKNRFFAEESGRLLTAFLERFFERYVAYEFTAELEDELDDVSGGRAQWKRCARRLLARLQAQVRRGHGAASRPKSPQALDEFLAPYLFPPRDDGTDPRLCPQCGKGRLSLRGGRFGAFVACSNYPECKYTRKFAQPAAIRRESDGGSAGTGRGDPPQVGPLRSYIQWRRQGDKRASIPKDVPVADVTAEIAELLSSLPREIGAHPETGKPITASIGRYGPYLAHDGKYAKLVSTAEVFETGMNAAVAKLADAATGGGRSAGLAPSRSRSLGRTRKRRRDQGDGRPLRALRHRRHDQCDSPARRRSESDHVGRSHSTDR